MLCMYTHNDGITKETINKKRICITNTKKRAYYKSLLHGEGRLSLGAKKEYKKKKI